MPDFEVYWRAGAARRAAEPLYRPEDGHYQLKYLPAFAVLADTAAPLPLAVAKAVWFGCPSSCWPRSARAAASRSCLTGAQKIRVLRDLTLVAMAKFYGHELVLGQVNVCCSVPFSPPRAPACARGRDTPAGVLVALAVVVKPYAVIFLPWLAAIRRGQALVAGIVTIAAAIAAAGPSLRDVGNDGAARGLVADRFVFDVAEPAER